MHRGWPQKWQRGLALFRPPVSAPRPDVARAVACDSLGNALILCVASRIISGRMISHHYRSHDLAHVPIAAQREPLEGAARTIIVDSIESLSAMRVGGG